mmetsp:Transcript_40912/g.73505  ORF Transcript_40912/g.73505 Transcript_40912/m.73505 type:complete len:203 (+) Transcript_40912:61-669(+)
MLLRCHLAHVLAVDYITASFILIHVNSITTATAIVTVCVVHGILPAAGAMLIIELTVTARFLGAKAWLHPPQRALKIVHGDVPRSDGGGSRSPGEGCQSPSSTLPWVPRADRFLRIAHRAHGRLAQQRLEVGTGKTVCLLHNPLEVCCLHGTPKALRRIVGSKLSPEQCCTCFESRQRHIETLVQPSQCSRIELPWHVCGTH